MSIFEFVVTVLFIAEILFFVFVNLFYFCSDLPFVYYLWPLLMVSNSYVQCTSYVQGFLLVISQVFIPHILGNWVSSAISLVISYWQVRERFLPRDHFWSHPRSRDSFASLSTVGRQFSNLIIPFDGQSSVIIFNLKNLIFWM